MNPGTQFGDYDLIRDIGAGKMGTVWLATRRSTGQQVAIKVVPGGSSEDDRKRLEVEKIGAELQRKIASHDSRVVAVNRILEFEGKLIVEMEYVAGDDLEKAIAANQTPADQAARIAMELCRMLTTLDTMESIVHGDLKPRNILLNRETVIKVIDFGIAQQVTRPGGNINEYQSLPYCSPERLQTNLVTHVSDLWAVGVILYQMVARVHPFASGSSDVKTRILNGAGPDPFPYAPYCPGPLKRIILKSLAVSPLDRYKNAREMAEDLGRFLSGEGLGAQTENTAGIPRMPDPNATTRVRRPNRVPAGSRSLSPLAPPSRRDPHSAPRLSRAVIVGGLFAVALLVLALFAYGYRDWRTMTEIRQALEADRMDPDDAWQKIASNPRSFIVRASGLRGVLEKRLFEAGQAPINDYRRDTAVSRRGDWDRAVTRFEKVIQLDPDNKIAQADLHLCKGHVKRIDARTIVKGKPPQYDVELQRQAIDHMEEVFNLLPDSPDPYLGLAQLYFYGKDDVEKGREMLNQAATRGHPIGKREKRWQADAFAARGARGAKEARDVAGNPDREKEFLQGAVQDYTKASTIYQEIRDFGADIPALIVTVDKKIGEINQRLQQVSGNQ